MADKKSAERKKFIVRLTYEVVVNEFSREDAIAEGMGTPFEQMTFVEAKCGTPKQMHREDV